MDQRNKADAALRAHSLLHEWVLQHGGRLDDRTQFARDDQRGVHIQVKPEQSVDLPRKTCVIKLPVALTMSYFDAIDYRLPAGDGDEQVSFSSHGVVFPKQFVTSIGSEETTAFFLMGQYLKAENGFWHPYIRSLPRPDELTTPLFYSDDDLAWLNMTSLAAAREQRLQIWRANYEKGVACLRELQFEDVDAYSWELYLWASTIISSRAFTAKVLAGVIPMDQLSEDKVSVLLPLVDATNHRPLAKVEWQAGTDSIGLAVMEDVTPGSEIGNNYGPRNNEQLMMNYGFCIPNNPFEYRTINLRAPPGSPLAQVKAQYEQNFSKASTDPNSEDKYYVFSIDYHHPSNTASQQQQQQQQQQPLEFSVFSSDLLNALSIIAANDRELETIEMDENGFRVPVEQYGNSRNFVAALNQIVIELLSYVQRLQTSASQLGEPRNLHQVYAKQYRESQIRLSQTAAFIANWVISLSRSSSSSSSSSSSESDIEACEKLLARVPSSVFDTNTAEKIKTKILTQASLLPTGNRRGEVFLFEQLFELLPSDIRDLSRQCLDQISTQARRVVVIGDDMGGGQKDEGNSGPHGLFAYSLFICFLVAAYRTNASRISPRLHSWCEFLLTRYTAPPNDVSWTLPDEDDEAILSAFDSLIDDHTPAETFVSVTPIVGATPATGERAVNDWWLSPNWIRWAWLVLEQEMVMNVVDEPLEYMIYGAAKGMKTVSLLYVPGVSQA